MTTIPKCQAKGGPSSCTDPACPEKQFHANISQNALDALNDASRKALSVQDYSDFQKAREAVQAAQFEYDTTRGGIQDLEEAVKNSTDDWDKGILVARLESAKERFSVKYSGSRVTEDTENLPLIPQEPHTYEIPTFKVVNPNDYYPATVGSKFSGYQTSVAVAKKVRSDLKEAQEKGYLPAHVSFSVKAPSNNVQVTVHGISDSRLFTLEKDSYGYVVERPTAEAKELKERIEGITSAYNSSSSKHEVDYFQETYYSRVQLETSDQKKRRLEDSELAKSKREQTKAVASVKNEVKSNPKDFIKQNKPKLLDKTIDGSSLLQVEGTKIILVEGTDGSVKAYDFAKTKNFEMTVASLASRDSRFFNYSKYAI